MEQIIEKIGTPALLEQVAEECVELAHACLKMSRKIREENPTPADLDMIHSKLSEEAADVMLCISALVETGFTTNEALESTMIYKETRWKNRLNISKGE